MAAYAALVSLMHIIDSIQLHPRPPISLDKTQIESLTANVTFLQEFLEYYAHLGYTTDAGHALESRIADAAHVAEDVIESHIVDQVLAEEIRSVDLYQDLQKVIQDMDLIKKLIFGPTRNSKLADSLISSSIEQNTVVGFGDLSDEIMERLIRQESRCEIIPIVGMGGIGKTTLARHIYQNQIVVQHFDILDWVSITPECKTMEILLELVREGGENSSQVNEYELGVKLHKRLCGRRYFVVIDDLWDIQVWNCLKLFFPDNNNGSRIMITSRLSNLASQVANTRGIEMDFLDEHNSWNLFRQIVFRKGDPSLELEEIGKKILRKCRGHPLSISVVGGLLADSRQYWGYIWEKLDLYWEYIWEKLDSIVSSEDGDYECCSKILHVIYNQLPVYLKPCFLYLGGFLEDNVIRVSVLIKLWVAEGFLKPINGKSMEETAEECLKELIVRNLVSVHKLGNTRRIKYCHIHDLVKDFCSREAQNERFCNVARKSSLDFQQGIDNKRRIIITSENALDSLQANSCVRSVVCGVDGVLPMLNSRLLRILKAFDRDSDCAEYFLERMFQLTNLRYLAVKAHPESKFPSSINRLWNLHTIIVDGNSDNLVAPSEIWTMPQLRYVEFEALHLPDPPNREQDDFVLGSLQTLGRIINFKCSEEVVKRIPNLRKLKIFYNELEGSSPYCLNNLNRLHKLESFCCSSFPEIKPSGTDFLRDLNLPNSLKRLTFAASHVHWEDILEKVGALPLLEMLKLMHGSFRTRKWETTRGHFRSLKFLMICSCDGLGYWTTESSHFPCLEHLVLYGLEELKMIPSEIGEIPTLQSIKLKFCNDSAVISAKEILGEVGVRVRVTLVERNEALESLAGRNFKVKVALF